MRCLYCGKQLALLKRLTGGGEFCSDAHKQSYQEEYNRLALSRLLQAQSKPGEIKTTHKAPTPADGLGQPLPPGAARRRALPNAAPAPAPAPEPARGRVYNLPAASTPVVTEEPVRAPVEEPAPPPREEVVAAPVEAVEETAGRYEEPVPPEVTVFAMEIPAFLTLDDESPYVEPWLNTAGSPVSPTWQASNTASNLPLGTLFALEASPPAGEIDFSVLAPELSAVEFEKADVSLSALSEWPAAAAAPSGAVQEAASEQPFSILPSAELVPLAICSAVGGTPLEVMDVAAAPAEFAGSKAGFDLPFAVKEAPVHAFPSASPIEIDIRITASGVSHQTSSNGALRFPVRISFQDSSLLNLSPSGIEFPPEDSEVVLTAPWADEVFAPSNGHGPADQNGPAPVEPSGSESGGSPREALQALSKLHQDLVEEQVNLSNNAPPAEVVAEPPVELELLSAPEQIAAPPDAPSATTIDISPEPVEERPIPGSAHDLFEIPVKTFAPAKPGLVVESTALISLQPEMPRLKGLPLRPKVAKAPPGFSPQPSAVQAKTPAADPKPKSPSAPGAPPRPEVKTTQVPVPTAKQPAAPVKSPPTVQPVKPGQPKPVQPVKSVPPQALVSQEPAGKAKPVTDTTANPASAKNEQPAAGQTKAGDLSPASPSPADSASTPGEEAMPRFESIQSKSTSLMGSLKGKLVIAICLVVTAGGVFLGWNNKSRKATAPAPVAEDAAGPSIMLGEGGWVQNWAGDTNASRAGRQITIYRPSLKLSDYRIEFKGEIETKSIGWVFRAMDPYNYYAMKLAVVTPGLNPQLALIRYAVVQGHETEMGRVPLNIAARNDTTFSVRMDVRGSKFNTSIQGQPVDAWTDEQLKSGGVGFLNERAERSRIKSASISYLSGGKN